MHRARTIWQALYQTALRIKPRVLNHDVPLTTDAPDDIAAALKRTINQIKSQATDYERGTVDYQALQASDIYAEYRQITAHLRDFELASVDSREEKLAFWINLYNALSIDGIIALGIRESMQEYVAFGDRVAYDIGGYFFSIEDIEHGILRANAGHPYVPGPQFSPGDPRLAFALKQRDIRTHFTLVCGAQSCPPIQFYEADKIDMQLDFATKNYLNGSDVEIDIPNRQVTLNKLLMWYAHDFGASSLVRWNGLGDKTPILRTIAPYRMNETERAFLEHGEAKVAFKPYDWRLNAA
ncbi:MAG: DUF547 domain-containing protein [Anaerolineales bacterium]